MGLSWWWREPFADAPFARDERVEVVEDGVNRWRGTVEGCSPDGRVSVRIDNSAIFEFRAERVRRLDVIERLGELA